MNKLTGLPEPDVPNKTRAKVAVALNVEEKAVIPGLLLEYRSKRRV